MKTLLTAVLITVSTINVADVATAFSNGGAPLVRNAGKKEGLPQVCRKKIHTNPSGKKVVITRCKPQQKPAKGNTPRTTI